MKVYNFQRLVFVYDCLRRLHEDGHPITVIRSTDIQNSMYVSGQYARKVIADWYEDGYLNRVFTGSDAQPRYDYTFTGKGIAAIKALSANDYWRAVQAVKEDARLRYATRPAASGGSVLNSASNGAPVQKKLL